MAIPPMPMRCISEGLPLGSRDHNEPTEFEWRSAQDRIKELYVNYRANNPARWEVFTELDYRNLRIPNNPTLTKVLLQMTDDFKRERARRPDVLAITGDGTHGELLEVKTLRNAPKGAVQLVSMLMALQSVSKILQQTGQLPFMVDWRAANWRPSRPPGPEERFYDPVSRSPRLVHFNELGEARWICYQPTFDLNAPPGLILYEIHRVKLDPILVPVPIPADIEKKLEEAARANRPTEETAEEWARHFIIRHPTIKQVLESLIYILGAAVVIAALIASLEVIIGAACAAVAIWLVTLAMPGGNNDKA